MAKLDDVSWHSDGLPQGVSEDNGATHIGIFVAWAIANGLWGDFLGAPQALSAIKEVRDRRMSGRAFLLEHCDGKLLSEMLNPEGARFAETYYRKKYMRDFQTTLAVGLPSDYHVENTWANYDRLAARIDERFAASKRKPWWKFW
jgi:hypothetical protein